MAERDIASIYSSAFIKIIRSTFNMHSIPAYKYKWHHLLENIYIHLRVIGVHIDPVKIFYIIMINYFGFSAQKSNVVNAKKKLTSKINQKKMTPVSPTKKAKSKKYSIR